MAPRYQPLSVFSAFLCSGWWRIAVDMVVGSEVAQVLLKLKENSTPGLGQSESYHTYARRVSQSNGPVVYEVRLIAVVQIIVRYRRRPCRGLLSPAPCPTLCGKKKIIRHRTTWDNIGFFSNFHRNLSVYNQTSRGHSICHEQILEISESWIEERKNCFPRDNMRRFHRDRAR